MNFLVYTADMGQSGGGGGGGGVHASMLAAFLHDKKKPRKQEAGHQGQQRNACLGFCGRGSQALT